MKKIYGLQVFIFFSAFFFMSSTSSCFAIEFTENKGQWNQHALFKANLKNGNVFLLDDGFLFTIHDKNQLNAIHEKGMTNSLEDQIRCHSYKLSFVKALKAEIFTAEKNNSSKNYFIGEDQQNWKVNVNSFGEITYKNIYPFIDLKVYAEKNNFKYDFILNPGADIRQLVMKVEGLNSITAVGNSLFYSTSISTMEEKIPLAYVSEKGGNFPVACNYLLKGNYIRFNIPGVTGRVKSKMVIDPVLLISTYSGSSGTTYGSSATYDTHGNLIIGAMLFDTGWPYTLGAYDVSFAAGIDMGITKFDSTGSNQLWSTYLGGNAQDVILNMISNANDELFVFGYSYQNFPVTTGAYDITPNGQNDLVVSRLSAAGNILIASTYIGGSEDEGRSLSLGMNVHAFGDLDKGEIRLDGNGNPVIASLTMSSNFPVTAGAYQNTNGGSIDACLLKLNSTLSQLMYSTYLGGSGDDACYGMCLDPTGNAVLTGGTNSLDFPVTAGAIQPAYGGGFSFQFDSFISVIDASGANLLASTYFGFNNSKDKGYKTALDTNGNIYVFGNSEGVLPVSPGVFSNQNSGNYLLKLNPSLSSILKCTSYGDGAGFPSLQPIAFHVDGCNQVYCAGFTSNTLGNPNQFPVTPGAQQMIQNGSQDAHVLVFAPDFASVIYGSYLGGAVREHTDAGSSVFDDNGVLYLGVCTEESISGGFPVTPNSFCPSSQTPDWDMAGVKWDFNGCPHNIGAVPVIALSSSDTAWCDKKAIDFFDLSTNNPTSWQWYFQGAVPDTSTAQHPVGIYYPSYGSFDVTLIACNQFGCDSITYPGFIHEFQIPPAPVVTYANDTLYSTTALNYQWYDLGGPIAGQTNFYYVPVQQGTYFVVITDSLGCSVPSNYFVIAGMESPQLLLNAEIIPNPFQHQLIINCYLKVAGSMEITIVDVMGRLVSCVTVENTYVGKNNIPLELPGLTAGIYFCTLKVNDSKQIFRLIKT